VIQSHQKHYAAANAPAFGIASATVTVYADGIASACVSVYATDNQREREQVIGIQVELQSFCADPYRIERDKLIEIEKQSGMNRARSSANRRKALENYLQTEGLTLKDYDDLKAKAEDPWETDAAGNIILPKLVVEAMLVATCHRATSAIRPTSPDMVRTVIRTSPWRTDATPDMARQWERFAVVNAGTGAKLSNQRGLRRNAYIGANPPIGDGTKPVTATGTIDINPTMVKPDTLKKAIEWAGEWVGIGASRKMGWGRFTLQGFTVN